MRSDSTEVAFALHIPPDPGSNLAIGASDARRIEIPSAARQGYSSDSG